MKNIHCRNKIHFIKQAREIALVGLSDAMKLKMITQEASSNKMSFDVTQAIDL